ncbi:potassium channel family protein [Nocardioides sp.]|uniref:potassium channel family protein n=1 Tax=Nocardioides sp. TaxID=35761 RepID=UPI001998E86E|nr:potassium channel family protein [Nocardioides sp.]MBC7277198.1 two pore domain potassium channel family protein [Nocardioides sp.]
MLDSLVIAAGVLTILTVFLDAAMTTLTVSTAAGPLTSHVLPTMWRVLLRIAGQGRRRALLSPAGAVLLLTTVLIWVAGLWGGWWLIFLGADTVEQSTTGRPAGFWDAGYFSGMTVITLGTGDFVADSTGWRVLSAVASFTGLFLVTLAITYLVSVLSAVVARRALAIHVRGLGLSAEDMVTRGWAGSGYSPMFEQQLIALTPIVATGAGQHLAYPVLHYFHATKPALSAPLALASLSDALLLAGELTAPSARPDPASVKALTYAMDQYLDAAGEVAWLPEQPAPPPPSTRGLEEHGIPLADAREREMAIAHATRRRTSLHRLVAGDGWTWDPAEKDETPDPKTRGQSQRARGGS